MSSVGEVWTRPVPPGVTEEALDAAIEPPPPAGGVLLIGLADDEALARFHGRQGYIGAYRDGDVVAVHWSSPLMHARALREHGALMPGAALYSSQRTVSA